ncbi:MAG: amidohydrolase family protein [Ilumatobacteraceae bacterium]
MTDLLVIGDVVITMDRTRRMIADGAVAISGDRIVAVGPRAEVVPAVPGATVVGGPGHLVLPGFVNAHQHLTGDRLVRSAIPDDITSHDAVFTWAVPIHAAHTPDDDELSATLALAEAATNGITFTVEAGTVAHPERVLAAFDRVGVGGTLGSWGWDVADGPWAGSVAEVLDRQRHTLDLARGHPRVDGWVTLVGHDLMSDELVVAASDLATQRRTRLTFHLSPTPADAVAYVARTGRRPGVHLDALGVLGPHVLLAHAVHLDDEEVAVVVGRDVAIAYCPWAYLRLGQGVAAAGRHVEIMASGGRVALGGDSENAGDAVDVLRIAALAAGLARDTAGAASGFGAHEALELATIGGARAIGMDHELGSLEVGKRADVVVIDASGPAWVPRSPDPVLQLVWGNDGRSVRHVVASGQVVVRDGRCTTVDVDALVGPAGARQRHLLAVAGLDPRPRWPLTR